MRLFIVILFIAFLTSCATAPVAPTITRVPLPKQQTKKINLLPKPEVSLLYPVKGGKISSAFGNRFRSFHRGVDIAAPIGSPVRACEKGKVVKAGVTKDLEGYGKTVLLKHSADIYTYYAHMHSVSVQVGNTVDRGQTIGTVGNSGKSRGPHLHLELIMATKNHNPVPYLVFSDGMAAEWGVWLKSVKKSIDLSAGLRRIIGGH